MIIQGILVTSLGAVASHFSCRLLFNWESGLTQIEPDVPRANQLESSFIPVGELIGKSIQTEDFGRQLVQHIVNIPLTRDQKFKVWVDWAYLGDSFFGFGFNYSAYYVRDGSYLLTGPYGYGMKIHRDGSVQTHFRPGVKLDPESLVDLKSFVTMEKRNIPQSLMSSFPEMKNRLSRVILNLYKENRYLEIAEIYSALNLKGAASVLQLTATDERANNQLESQVEKNWPASEGFKPKEELFYLLATVDKNFNIQSLPFTYIIMRNGIVYLTQHIQAEPGLREIPYELTKEVQNQRGFMEAFLGMGLRQPIGSIYEGFLMRSEFNLDFISHIESLPKVVVQSIKTTPLADLVKELDRVLSPDNMRVATKRMEFLQLLLSYFYDSKTQTFNQNAALQFIERNKSEFNFSDYKWQPFEGMKKAQYRQWR